MSWESKNLSKELDETRKQVEKVAKDCGLDFFPTIFQVLDFATFNDVTSNLGFPLRYQHWRFGMEFERLQKELGYGFGRIYEIVINTNPSIAYLLEYNTAVQQKTVMAHVFAHVDFFKNNYAFQETNRNMINVMADNATMVDNYIKRMGLPKVEAFIESAVSIEELIDPESVRMNNVEKKLRDEIIRVDADQFRIPTDKPYLEPFLNNEEYIKKKVEEEIEKRKKMKQMFPSKPERDILKFLIDYSDKLPDWQRELLSMVREESYYFEPQKRTKIMNEGWAVFWHSHIMAERGLAGFDGIIDYAQFNSQIAPTGGVSKSLNPYVLGFLLFKDIKNRWDKGRHGKEYNQETDYNKKRRWDTKEGGGLEKIFEVRKSKTDIEFIREFLTPEFIRESNLFIYKHDEFDGTPRISDKDASNIRRMILYQMTNHGQPIITVEDGNFNNTKELCLKHKFIGTPLDIEKAERTLSNIYKMWGRPIHLRTVWKNKKMRLTFDGKELESTKEGDLSKDEIEEIIEDFGGEEMGDDFS